MNLNENEKCSVLNAEGSVVRMKKDILMWMRNDLNDNVYTFYHWIFENQLYETHLLNMQCNHMICNDITDKMSIFELAIIYLKVLNDT